MQNRKQKVNSFDYHASGNSSFNYKSSFGRARSSTPRHKARSLKYSLFLLMMPIVSIWCVVGVLSYFKIDELSNRSNSLTSVAIPSVENSDRIQRDMVKIAYHVDLIAQSNSLNIAYFNYISLVNLIRSSALYYIPDIHEELAVMRANLEKMYKAKKELNEKTKDIVNYWFLYYATVQNYYILSGQIELLDEITTHDHSGLTQGYVALDQLVRSHIKPFYNHVGTQCELIFDFYTKNKEQYKGDLAILGAALQTNQNSKHDLAIAKGIVNDQFNDKFIERPDSYSAYKVEVNNSRENAKLASGVEVALAVPSRYVNLPNDKNNNQARLKSIAQEKILAAKNDPEYLKNVSNEQNLQQELASTSTRQNAIKEDEEEELSSHKLANTSLNGDIGIDKAAIAAEAAALESDILNEGEDNSADDLVTRLHQAVDNFANNERQENSESFTYNNGDFVYKENGEVKEDNYLAQEQGKIDFNHELLKILRDNESNLASPKEEDSISGVPQAVNVLLDTKKQNEEVDGVLSSSNAHQLAFKNKEQELSLGKNNLSMEQQKRIIAAKAYRSTPNLEHVDDHMLVGGGENKINKTNISSKENLFKVLDINPYTNDDKYLYTCNVYTKSANQLYHALKAQKVSLAKFHRVYSDLLNVISAINAKAVGIARTPISSIAIEVEDSAKKVYVLALIAILASIASVLYIYRSINRYFCDPVQRLVEVVGEFNITYRIPDPRENPMKECQDVILTLRPVFENYRRIMQQNGDLNNIDTMLGQVHYFDGITHLHNRNALDEIASKSPDLPFNSAVVLVDIDNFRSLNEANGENAGDEALSLIARCLKSNISRDHDMIFRYDDDEFCIILNKTTYSNALDTCHRLLKQVEALNIRNRAYTRSFTITIGMSYICDDADVFTTNFVEHIAYAHEALNCGKRNGGNQVQVFKEFKDLYAYRHNEQDETSEHNDSNVDFVVGTQSNASHLEDIAIIDDNDEDYNLNDNKEKSVRLSSAQRKQELDMPNVVASNTTTQKDEHINDNAVLFKADNDKAFYDQQSMYQELELTKDNLNVENNSLDIAASNRSSYVMGENDVAYNVYDDREVRLQVLRSHLNQQDNNDNVVINYGDEDIDLSKEEDRKIDPNKWANNNRRFSNFTQNQDSTNFSLENNSDNLEITKKKD